MVAALALEDVLLGAKAFGVQGFRFKGLGFRV